MYLELRNAFLVFLPNLAMKNTIEFQNIASYVLELLRVFHPNLAKRPETCLSRGHFVIQDNVVLIDEWCQ